MCEELVLLVTIYDHLPKLLLGEVVGTADAFHLHLELCNLIVVLLGLLLV
jgi:hypothetical protein